MLTLKEIEIGLKLLEISKKDLEKVRLIKDLNKANKALRLLKRRANIAYKYKVVDLHPDRNGGDKVKSRQFDLMTQVHNMVKKLTINSIYKLIGHTEQNVSTSVSRKGYFRGPSCFSFSFFGNRWHVVMQTLGPGDSCMEVKTIRKMLSKAGFDSNLSSIYNCDYDYELSKIVSNFQRSHLNEQGKPCKVDGLVGEETWHALRNPRRKN